MNYLYQTRAQFVQVVEGDLNLPHRPDGVWSAFWVYHSFIVKIVIFKRCQTIWQISCSNWQHLNWLDFCHIKNDWFTSQSLSDLDLFIRSYYWILNTRVVAWFVMFKNSLVCELTLWSTLVLVCFHWRNSNGFLFRILGIVQICD